MMEERRLCRARRWILLAAALVFTFLPLGKSFWGWLYADSRFAVPLSYDIPSLLRIHVLDVGKADAILLESQGCTALLDAGTSAHGEKVADYLARQGVTALDFLIMSHPDSDHVGGMVQILREVPVGMFLEGARYGNAEGLCQEYKDVQVLLQGLGTPSHTAGIGEMFPFGSGEIQVLGPVDIYEGSNNNSLVLKLSCPGFSALFCGDIEKEAELDLVKSGQDLSATLLKVAHHGSGTSSTRRFIEAVSPQIAVIPVGPDNNNLPRQGTLARLGRAGARVFRTDLDGTVVFSYNKGTVTVTTSQKQ